jgi:outer membrane protein assembly factor BamE (lipoprotein component of BamABCDE complex)
MNRLALLLALFLFGCASDSAVLHRIALLHEGMTQQEVYDLLGKPRTVNNLGALFVNEYVFTQPVALHDNAPPTMSYYVIIGRDGRVRSFGPN